jgi:hypothetical protein
MLNKSRRCLFLYPRFTSQSFWNYRSTCELLGAKYPAAPLGLATIAAMVPEEWEKRLVDTNVEQLMDEDIEWCELVFIGGMISQQPDHLRYIDFFKSRGKTVIVGGPDATNSPHLYRNASHLVLGEAEVSLPEFLADFMKGEAKHSYVAGERKADVTTTPIPLFNLLKFDRYLHVGIQIARGCPFKCEFCDIIELFGRVPRVKPPEQVLAELQKLYDLGYRGHVDIVDDNFIGNRSAAKLLLPKLKDWLVEHKWPFEFSTEASINLANDEDLMKLMQEVGFSAVFVGIESPDEVTLKAMQKNQNTTRPIPESIHAIMRHGMIVNAGYIVGSDEERGRVARGTLDSIENTTIPINMVGLLFALPTTQLARRLAAEGRLHKEFEVAPNDKACQTVAGLNFDTQRPREEILEDFKAIIAESYSPAKYFGRVRRFSMMMDCSKKKLRVPLKRQIKDIWGLFKLIRIMGITGECRGEFWRTFFSALTKNPKSIRYVVALMALYVHFYSFKDHIISVVQAEIDGVGREPASDRTEVSIPQLRPMMAH